MVNHDKKPRTMQHTSYLKSAPACMSVSTVKLWFRTEHYHKNYFLFLLNKQYAVLRERCELTVTRIQEANGHKSSRPNMSQELPPFWLLPLGKISCSEIKGGLDLELQAQTNVIMYLHPELLIFFTIDTLFFVMIFSVTDTLKFTFMASLSSNLSHLTSLLHILYR